jgi:hypothetical protein
VSVCFSLPLPVPRSLSFPLPLAASWLPWSEQSLPHAPTSIMFWPLEKPSDHGLHPLKLWA